MMEIMKQVDLDYDGKIQFSEFLIACCNKRLLLSDEHLKEAFKQIDTDGNGQITEDDLQTFMGEEASKDYVGGIMYAADANHNGEIDY